MNALPQAQQKMASKTWEVFANEGVALKHSKDMLGFLMERASIKRPTSRRSSHHQCDGGFSRTELCVVLAVLTFLALALGSSLARSREPGQRVGCANNLRQLGIALLLYSSENDCMFPSYAPPPFWPGKLQRYYGQLSILQCPSDAATPTVPGRTNPADAAQRSYIFNRWDDYFWTTLSPEEWSLFNTHRWPFCMPETAIPHPSDTIALGEKITDSYHFYVDILTGVGNDIMDVEYSRHFRFDPADPTTGGSNYAMADGSVRYLKYGKALAPLVLWAVFDPFRTNYCCFP